MNKINNEEKFKNCSQLCKPHESNKILWTMKNNHGKKDFTDEIKRKGEQLKDKILHSNFI